MTTIAVHFSILVTLLIVLNYRPSYAATPDPELPPLKDPESE